MFDARELEIGEFFDRDRFLSFRRGLQRAGHATIGSGRGMRVAVLGCVPSGMRIHLRLTQAGEVVVDGIFGIEAEVLGVSADESFIEDSTGKQVEVFLFDRLQHARADFGDAGNVVEREFFFLARLAKFFSELAHW